MRVFLLVLACALAAGCSYRALGIPDPERDWESEPCVFRFPTKDRAEVHFVDDAGNGIKWIQTVLETVAGVVHRKWDLSFPAKPVAWGDGRSWPRGITEGDGRFEALPEGCGLALFRTDVPNAKPAGYFPQVPASFDTPLGSLHECYCIEVPIEIVEDHLVEPPAMKAQHRVDMYCANLGLVSREIDGVTMQQVSRNF